MTEARPAAQSPEDIVVLGKIVDAYGLRGAVKVHPFADDPASWGGLRQWWLSCDDGESALWREVRLVRSRVQGGALVATLEGVIDRTAAESLIGQWVGALRAALPETASGEYYWADLIGLDVVNVRGESLGRVLGLIETAANDVLRVGGGEGKERLLPFVGAIVRDVDLATGRIEVDWEFDW